MALVGRRSGHCGRLAWRHIQRARRVSSRVAHTAWMCVAYRGREICRGLERSLELVLEFQLGFGRIHNFGALLNPGFNQSNLLRRKSLALWRHVSLGGHWFLDRFHHCA